jgi:hypothetical protein
MSIILLAFVSLQDDLQEFQRKCGFFQLFSLSHQPTSLPTNFFLQPSDPPISNVLMLKSGLAGCKIGFCLERSSDGCKGQTCTTVPDSLF